MKETRKTVEEMLLEDEIKRYNRAEAASWFAQKEEIKED